MSDNRSRDTLPAADEGLDLMFERPRGSRVTKAILLVVLISLAAVIWLAWRSMRMHLGAVAMLEARGATVEWDINKDNWTQGGVTRVTRGRRNAFPTTEIDMSELENLRNPVELDLGFVTITDAGFAHLAHLELLEVLSVPAGPNESLTKPQVTNAALVHLRGLKRLKELNLARRAINDDGLANLAGLTSLKTLDLEFSQVTDAGLRHLMGLTQLEDLNLRGTALTDGGLLELAALPRLRTLTVQGTSVTARGISKLLRQRPAMDVYHDFNVEDIDKAFR